MKLNYILCFVLFSCASQGDNTLAESEDTLLHSSRNNIVVKLDSITKLDSSLRIGADEAYFLFRKMADTLKNEDLFYLIKSHENPVIRGYAYMALKLHSINNAESFYRSNFKPIKWLCVYDVCHAYGDKDTFINKLNIKIKRIQNIERMKSKELFSEEEKKAMKEEEKIRKEQDK